jgi:PAT family beta-lactamase induction signal transducer AmpG
MEASVIDTAPRAGLAEHPKYKYVLLFFLCISQSIPAAFFVMAFPVLLRQEGTSLNYIGLLNLLLLPTIFKPLWAPLVDAKGTYRMWILPTQIICMGLMVTIGFYDWVKDFYIVYTICFLYAIVSTTQHIGIDGLSVRILDHHERPIGNSLNVAGQYLGTVIGGGAMIMLYGKLGMHVNIGIITAVLAIPAVLLLPYREPLIAKEQRIPPSLKALVAVFKRPNMAVWMVTLLIFNFAPMMSGTLLRPLLVDRKVSLEQIGFLFGVLTPIVAIAGCALAPLLINRLGRKWSLVLFTAIGLLQILSDSLMASGMVGIKTIYACVAFLGFTSGFAGILSYAIIMDKSEAGSAGTDFSVQVTLVVISLMISGVAAGFIGQAAGYKRMFAGCAVLQAIVLAGIARWVQTRDLERPAETPAVTTAVAV